jgi:hypothetical protein
MASFSVRGDRVNASKMLEEIKSVMHESSVQADVLVEGFIEVGSLRFVRESKMSGFVWLDDLHRYIHASENPQAIRHNRR